MRDRTVSQNYKEVQEMTSTNVWAKNKQEAARIAQERYPDAKIGYIVMITNPRFKVSLLKRKRQK